MKNAKLLLLSLPLLLAVASCTTKPVNPSNPSSSSDSSEPEPSSSSHYEEPLPEKTPEELEQEALADLSILKRFFDDETYYFKSYGIQTTRSGIIGKGIRVISYGYYEGSYHTKGYLASNHGVLSLTSYCEALEASQCNGYAVKTNDLTEAVALVEGYLPKLQFQVSDWEYVSRVNGYSNFQTTNETIRGLYAFYKLGYNDPSLYEKVYLNINPGFSSVTMRSELENTVTYESIEFKYFDLTKYLDYFWYEMREFYENLDTREYSDTEWGYNFYSWHYSFYDGWLPFPTDGDRYHFVESLRVEEFEPYPLRIGFINSGDITSSYALQLKAREYREASPETPNVFVTDYARVELEYVSAAETGRADLYPQGIFYIYFERLD